MEIKLIFWIIGIILVFYTFYLYMSWILKWEIKPHLYTQILYFIVTGIIFLGKIESEAWYGLLYTGSITLYSTITIFLAFKYWTKDIILLDKILLMLGLSAIPLWYYSGSPFYSIILLTWIDLFATIPTLRKTYNDPYSESIAVYLVSLLSIVLTIWALSQYNAINLIYLVYLVWTETTFILLMWWRRTIFNNYKSNDKIPKNN